MLTCNHLAGFGARRRSAAAGPITAITAATHNVSSGTSCTIPASTVPGDLLIYADYRGATTSGGAAPSSVTPTGFTLIGSSVSSGPSRFNLSSRIAQSGDAGSSIAGMTGGGGGTKYIIRISGNGFITTATATGVVSEGTSGNPASKTILSAAGTPPLVTIAAWANWDQLTAITSYSETEDLFCANGNDDLLVAVKWYNSSPADVTFDMGDDGDGNILFGCYIPVS